MREQVRRLGVGEHVRFLGAMPRDELRAPLSAADAFVLATSNEGWANVFLEAMASGIFPMGTYFGGMKSSIDALHGLIPDRDLELMKIDAGPAELVSDLVEKLPSALQMGDRWRRELRKAAVENYDWRSVAETLYGTLEGIAQKAREPSTTGKRAHCDPAE